MERRDEDASDSDMSPGGRDKGAFTQPFILFSRGKILLDHLARSKAVAETCRIKTLVQEKTTEETSSKEDFPTEILF